MCDFDKVSRMKYMNLFCEVLICYLLDREQEVNKRKKTSSYKKRKLISNIDVSVSKMDVEEVSVCFVSNYFRFHVLCGK